MRSAAGITAAERVQGTKAAKLQQQQQWKNHGNGCNSSSRGINTGTGRLRCWLVGVMINMTAFASSLHNRTAISITTSARKQQQQKHTAKVSMTGNRTAADMIVQ